MRKGRVLLFSLIVLLAAMVAGSVLMKLVSSFGGL